MTQGATTAALNFAANRDPGGIWSNLTPEIRTQALTAQKVEIADARALAKPPSLDAEGFCVVNMPMDDPAWSDEAWVAESYIPACLSAVKNLTGADHVASMHAGVLLRDTGNAQAAPAADFVHLDHTRQSALPFLEEAVDAETRARFPHVRAYNVWRAITPPPQDVPLALCDQRSHRPEDWVVGRTVEPLYPDGVPYVISVPDPHQHWFYFSDLSPDEAVIFKGWDSDPTAPFGVMHGAFTHPGVPPGSVPRASVEARVFALFAE